MTKKGHFSGKRRMPTLPTATKEQKVQKIRNAEYYDFQGIQDTLYAQSKENKVFRKLMSIILSEENIMLAYRNIKKNTGSHTPGVDGKTIKDLSEWQEDRLITYIRTRLKHYIPQPVRRVEIPKANGKTSGSRHPSARRFSSSCKYSVRCSGGIRFLNCGSIVSNSCIFIMI